MPLWGKITPIQVWYGSDALACRVRGRRTSSRPSRTLGRCSIASREYTMRRYLRTWRVVGVLKIRSSRRIGLGVIDRLKGGKVVHAPLCGIQDIHLRDTTSRCNTALHERCVRRIYCCIFQTTDLEKTRRHGLGKPHGDFGCSILSMRLYRIAL